MNILLTSDLEEIVNERIKSGQYNSPSEVIREGLLLLKEQDEIRKMRLEKIRAEVMLGVEQMQQGKYRVYDSAKALSEEVNRRGLKRLEHKKSAEKSNGDC